MNIFVHLQTDLKNRCIALAIAMLENLPPKVARRSLTVGEWSTDGNYEESGKSCPIGAGLKFEGLKWDQKFVDYIARLAVAEAGKMTEYKALVTRLNMRVSGDLRIDPFGVGLSFLTQDQVTAALTKSAKG